MKRFPHGANKVINKVTVSLVKYLDSIDKQLDNWLLSGCYPHQQAPNKGKDSADVNDKRSYNY